MVGIWNDRYVRSPTALRGRAQSSQHQGLDFRLVLGDLSVMVLPRALDEQFIAQTQPLEA